MTPTMARNRNTPRMALRYAVTFEYDQVAPETARGEIHVPNARLGARRALEAASKQYPGRRWQSIVILLERVGGDDVT